MAGFWRKLAVATAAVVLSALVAGGGIAATRSSDEAALAPTRAPANSTIETKVNALLSKMTLDEKLQQLQLDADWQVNDTEAQNGVGSVFSLTDPVKINHFQHVAVEQSRLHIPILFAF